MRIDSIEEIEDDEYSFDVYFIDRVENGSMMFANNTILHMGSDWNKLNLAGIIGIIQDNPKLEKL